MCEIGWTPQDVKDILSGAGFFIVIILILFGFYKLITY